MKIDELPPDQYNVVVENDMDHARLLWLVNEIGEDKLRKSVAKYQARYPGCQPFVSTMLKRFGRTVPVEVYAPKPIPVYWLYLLSLKDSPKVKVGFTGHWPQRAFAFLPGPRYFPVRTDLPDLLYPAVRQAALLDLFDGDRSFAYLVGNDRKEAAGARPQPRSSFPSGEESRRTCGMTAAATPSGSMRRSSTSSGSSRLRSTRRRWC
jgi:hypothetical protein